LQSGFTSLDTYQMYESLEHTEGKKSQHRRHSDLYHRYFLCYVVFSFLVSSCSSKPDVSHVVMMTSHFNQLFTDNKEHEHCNRYPVPAHMQLKRKIWFVEKFRGETSTATLLETMAVLFTVRFLGVLGIIEVPGMPALSKQLIV